jgi:hypothetical protein
MKFQIEFAVFIFEQVKRILNQGYGVFRNFEIPIFLSLPHGQWFMA